jgi:formate C-acetyltransferase
MAALGSMGWRAFAAPARKQRGYTDTTWWDPYVENITDSDTYLRRKFRQDVTDKTTGIGTQAIKKRLAEIVAAGKASGESWRITKAKCFAAQALEMSIDVSPLDWFPAISIWNRHDRPIYGARGGRHGEMNAKLPAWVKKEWHEGNRDGTWNMWQDFDHSVPDWRVILKLGFPGMKARLEKYASGRDALPRVRNGQDARCPSGGDPFYEGLKIAMDAMLAGIDRFIAQGKKNLGREGAPETFAAQAGAGRDRNVCGAPRAARGNDRNVCGAPRAAENFRLAKEIACLERLRNGPPQTAYDMMMFVWLYFFWSEHLDGFQCRSLTELDVFLTPYYDADIAAGRTTEAEFREHLKHFLWQWGSISNYWNQPVGLGGTNADGTSAFNHVSKIILEVMDECNLTTPKFLVKIAPNTPDWAMDKMMDMARRHRSLSFTGEMPLANALKKWQGASDDDCRKAVMTGCYEFQLHDGANQTGVGHVNFLKPIEKMLAEAAGGSQFTATDPGGGGRNELRPSRTAHSWACDFPSFKAEYLRRLAATTTRCREIAFEFEKVLADVNPADLMTIATEHALKTRKDGFMNGCPRGNNSAILAVGPGTAVDALLAVKEIVYEKKEMSLAELGKVMAENWKGHEALRLRMLRSKRKWGNNDPEANALGAELIDCYAGCLNGKPNSRGGIFLACGHCARQFIDLGRRTGATPDGRHKGDEMSKNLSPTMGVDTEGATALVNTLAASNSTKLPADYPLDMMLHPSVCAGKKGLEVMKALVQQFHANGGSVIQFTVFSAEELRDAQAHPEKYENLQVRVCGWNVRWNDLSKAEQDTYICRAENVMRGY